MPDSRRHFLKQTAVTSAFLGLSRFATRSAHGADGEEGYRYGKLIPDPQRIFDLPAGFTYKIIGHYRYHPAPSR